MSGDQTFGSESQLIGVGVRQRFARPELAQPPVECQILAVGIVRIARRNDEVRLEIGAQSARHRLRSELRVGCLMSVEQVVIEIDVRVEVPVARRRDVLGLRPAEQLLIGRIVEPVGGSERPIGRRTAAGILIEAERVERIGAVENPRAQRDAGTIRVVAARRRLGRHHLPCPAPGRLLDRTLVVDLARNGEVAVAVVEIKTLGRRQQPAAIVAMRGNPTIRVDLRAREILAQDDVHHARHCIRAVDRRGARFQDLDLLNQRHRNVRQIHAI